MPFIGSYDRQVFRLPGEAIGKAWDLEQFNEKESGCTGKAFMAEQELPYEKFLRLGAGALTEAELLAIIIRTGTPQRPALEIGREILNLPSVKEEGLNGLYHITVRELTAIKGIGEVKAVKIKCLAELSMRMAMRTAKKDLQFLNPATVADYYMERLRHERREQVLLLLLNGRNGLLGEEVLSIGTMKASLLSPREVFLAALKMQAAYIMLLHNHPNGDPSPSRQDLDVTEDIRQIGVMIDIPLIDHIIIGDNKYMSFKEAGFL